MTQRFDIVVVGGGTAGCILAARLSEDSSRTVCLLEAGPDYGPLAGGRWPAEMLDARAMPFTHDWGSGGEDGRSLGARILGGSSAHNACAMLAGTPADYDEWGPGWGWETIAPYLARARAALRTQRANTDRPAPFHAAVVEAAQALGLPLLADADDPASPVGVAPFPANAVDGVRWNAALAYLDPARARPNLSVRGGTLVDRVLWNGTRAAGVATAGGERLQAGTVVLAAGAYFTPALLVRSGVGPAAQLAALGVRAVADLPVGEQLLDHCGTGVAWEPTEALHDATAAHEDEHGPLFQPHLVLKAASSLCEPGSFDLHFLTWTNRAGSPGRYEASCGVFHVKPRPAGRVRVTSLDPEALPRVERGFLAEPGEVTTLVEGLELARRLAATEPLDRLLGRELRPGDVDLAGYVRSTVRNYFHPAGTCAIGRVVDPLGRVLGVEHLVVADASVLPTLPRANTNLTVAAVAERLAETVAAGGDVSTGR